MLTVVATGQTELLAGREDDEALADRDDETLADRDDETLAGREDDETRACVS
jgi:hypothetical protein